MPLARPAGVREGRGVDQGAHGVRRRPAVGAGQVEGVARVAGGVAGRGDAQAAAGLELVAGHLEPALQLRRRLDQRRHQPRHDVPLDVAVEQVHARVVGPEPDRQVRPRVEHDRVALQRPAVRRLEGAARVVAAVGRGPRDDLERVAVRVPGMPAVL